VLKTSGLLSKAWALPNLQKVFVVILAEETHFSCACVLGQAVYQNVQWK
jgi:hypothetical protein